MLLAVLYAWHRRHYIYDHIITALHVQTFIYLLATGCVLTGAVFPALLGWLVTAGIFLGIFYIYRQLRVTYDTGRFMAALRTLILFMTGFIVLSSLAVSLVILSFYLT